MHALGSGWQHFTTISILANLSRCTVDIGFMALDPSHTANTNIDPTPNNTLRSLSLDCQHRSYTPRHTVLCSTKSIVIAQHQSAFFPTQPRRLQTYQQLPRKVGVAGHLNTLYTSYCIRIPQQVLDRATNTRVTLAFTPSPWRAGRTSTWPSCQSPNRKLSSNTSPSQTKKPKTLCLY